MLDMLPQETEEQPLEWTPRTPAPYTPSEESLQIIRQARSMISRPWRWTRYEEARDWLMRPVSAESDVAVRMCGRGAVKRAGFERGSAPMYITEALKLLHGEKCLEDLNDLVGRRAVLARMDFVLASNA